MASLNAIVLFFILGVVHGLYEDQINKYDWKKEYIGKVVDVVYDDTMSISKNLYVITEQDVVASLASKNGQLNWRQVSDDKLVKILQFGDKILTVSENGVMRIWDSISGLLRWDVNFGSYAGSDVDFKFVDTTILELDYAEGNLIILLTTNGLYVITPSHIQSGAKAKPKISFQKFKRPIEGVGKLYVDSESKEICVLDFMVGLSVTTRFFDVKLLSESDENEIQTAWLDNLNAVVVTENKQLIYASGEMDAMYLTNLKTGSTENRQLSEFGINTKVEYLKTAESCDLASIGTDFFMILQNGDVLHMRESENFIEVIKRISGAHEAKTFVSVIKTGRERHYFIGSTQGQSLTIQAYDLTSGSEDENINFKLPSNVGGIEKIFINMFLKKTSPIGFRALVVTEDECFMMITIPTRLAWRRDEALGSVSTAEMLDLPLSDIEAGIEVEFEKAGKLNPIEMFVNRLKAQIGQIQTFTKQITKGIKEGTLFEKKTKDPLVQDESMTRDPFSLHKMLVLVTKCGKVFGMDSLSGDILWQFYFPEMKDRNFKLFIQRTTSHFPNPPSAVLLASGKSDENTMICSTFNPITGEVTGTLDRFTDIMQASLLPFSDSTHIRPLILMSKDGEIQLLPDSSEIRSKLGELHKSIYLFNVDQNENKISGHWMSSNMNMIETFVIRIPKDQKILTVKAKDLFEKIDSVGRPLADRSVIYKYLNPNLVLVMTGSKNQSDPSGMITMYLIDGVTGAIVYYANHKKASEPVHAVHSENWVVYSYWNIKARRTEIASYELYEGKERRNTTKFSSFDHVSGVPQVTSQAYILNGIVTAMGVSVTEKGLTSRQILLGLGRGSVMGIPRKVFDPRRPLRMRQSDKEEGLIPYVPEIQIAPVLLISYNKTIQGIRNIYTCSSALESTSIVLVTGLDIFFTRTHPSKMFDVLKEDFEYFLIIAVLVGMFIVAVGTRILAQIKKLKKAWR